MRKGRFAGFNMTAPAAMRSMSAGRRALAAVLILCAPVLVPAAAMIDPEPLVLIAAAAVAVLSALIGLYQLGAGDEPEAPEVALAGAQLNRFVAEFEESGSGWFWETNADGLIVYVSTPLATILGRDAAGLIGRPFEELTLAEEGAGEGEDRRRTLDFHLSRRFPFADVPVSPQGRRDLCWSLSGRPRFDEVGRFLGFRGIGLQLSEAQQAERRERHLAVSDSLTGLANRARMRAMLNDALANSAVRHEGCGLFMIDLDRFKQVNDTLGHPIGDLLLKEVAQRLTSVIGGEGQVGRLGGDEFEALLPGIDEEGVLASIAERLIGEVSAPYLIRGHNIVIGTSVGIAISRPGRTLADALVKEADLALYAAKRAGRGTYRFFEAEMHAEESDRRLLENDLRVAVAAGQLRLAFQPVVSALSEDLLGFEALLRWAHPTRGLLAPADFLPLAEAAGLVSAIDGWAIRTACAEAARWPDHLRVSVNLAAGELEQPGLVATVAGALAAAGIEPDRLELDLPEAALLADSGDVRAVLDGLDRLGVRLALDDFGSGHASFASLKAAPLDRIKLHPDLLRSAAPEGSRARAVVAAIIALGDSLGMEVTAEGVETPDDLALVRALGLGTMQGYLFARPMEREAALALAAASAPISAGEAVRARPPRHSLIRRGSLRWRGGTLSVRLRNISAEGAMIESGESVDPGAEVELDLSEGVRVAGEVRWSENGRIGLRFAEAFDLKRLGSPRRSAKAGILKPDYLRSELQPDSPWAARQDRFTVKDVKRR